ncbi:MAG TPA: class I SAM-dependent methyltransferase, partial [Gemmatimonadaceae bacterium]|nr:class I SAM-dependent methyltransferase [Gemmatimonadaceae bacterium]
TGVRFLSGSATSLPFDERTFDFVLACDGLYSWELDAADRHKALGEIRRVVRVGGHSLFTEHTRPEHFDHFIGGIVDGGFRVVSISYLYDRLWYQIESWFGPIRDLRVTRKLLRNVRVARSLQAIGGVVGRRASRHVCVLAMRSC